MIKPLLSKTQYIKAKGCRLNLYNYLNRKEALTPLNAEARYNIFAGQKFEEIARTIFNKKGEMVNCAPWEITQGLERTKKLMDEGVDVIYEATVMNDIGVYARIDILGKDNDGAYHIVEVKCSDGPPKEYHLLDVGFQLYVAQTSGLNIKSTSLAMSKKWYQREEKIDAGKMVELYEVSAQLTSVIKSISEDIQEIIDFKVSKTEPEAPIGSHCLKPFQCESWEFCSKRESVPEASVFNVFRKGKKLDKYLNAKKYGIGDIDEDESLTKLQDLVVQAFKTGREYYSFTDLKKFVSQLKYPLNFVDYETIAPKIPIYPGCKSKEMIPFQFSLHIQHAPGMKDDELTHIEFLSDGKMDERETFTKQLISSMDNGGSVIVYYKGFEVERNNELARKFPQYSSGLDNINSRVVDIFEPFKSKHIYNSKMNGSASLKYVYPAMCPEKEGYSALDIKNGGDASFMYLDSIINPDFPEHEREKLLSNLRAYCALDTLSMKHILDKILKIIA
jgi:hypothetical protein